MCAYDRTLSGHHALQVGLCTYTPAAKAPTRLWSVIWATRGDDWAQWIVAIERWVVTACNSELRPPKDNERIRIERTIFIALHAGDSGV